MIEYLASKHFLDFMRFATQNNDILRIDAQGTCYISGHFLRKHNDIVTNERRLYA